YLIISTWKGTDHRYRISFKHLKGPDAPVAELIDNFDYKYEFVGNDGSVFYFQTDLNAPRGRVIAIDVRKPEPANYKEIIPQEADNLTGTHMVGNQFVGTYLKDAHTQVKMFDVAGKFIREVEFPTI